MLIGLTKTLDFEIFDLLYDFWPSFFRQSDYFTFIWNIFLLPFLRLKLCLKCIPKCELNSNGVFYIGFLKLWSYSLVFKIHSKYYTIFKTFIEWVGVEVFQHRGRYRRSGLLRTIASVGGRNWCFGGQRN
jgi:hypothetical protein